ncbi:phosphate acyltransferase PlsX [Candidatus Zixiibacteriota bacterium]
MRIALDAMGGDFAPDRIVAGAVEAAASARGAYEIVLVGDQAVLNEQFGKLIHGLPIEIAHADEVIAMDEAPASALRRKKTSSISVAMELHRTGEVDAVISAGNTGAAMGSALLTLGRLKGVSRPAIASLFPSTRGASLVLDVGANTEVTVQNLMEFAVMGSLSAERVFGITDPMVGLLSIGEEGSKGTEMVVESHAKLLDSGLNFIGNVQGQDILTGAADVIVCDGFTGNIVLKFTEGITSFLTAGVKRGLSKSPIAYFGALLMTPVLDEIKKDLDYEEYGGAPLLGINGVVIICHGGSSVKAIRNAVAIASRMAEEQLNEHIKARLEEINVADLQR